MFPKPEAATHSLRDAWILEFPLELRAEAEDLLLSELERALTDKPKLLILDFTRVAFANGAGIGILVDILRRSIERSLKVAIVAVNGQPRLILDRVGLARYAPLYESIEQAVAGVSS